MERKKAEVFVPIHLIVINFYFKTFIILRRRKKVFYDKNFCER